jgi:hypothetical protein
MLARIVDLLGQSRKLPGMVGAAMLLAGLVLWLVVAGMQHTASAAVPLGGERVVSRYWDVISIGSGERSLILVSEHDYCDGPVKAQVHETSVSVTVELVEGPRPQGACPPLITSGWLYAQLAHPLAGRAILGRLSIVLPPAAVPRQHLPGEPRDESITPGLIGLAPADAEHALALLHLRGHILVIGHAFGRRCVVAQDPAAGHVEPAGEAVRMTVEGTDRS